jgi:hypothetical protein
MTFPGASRRLALGQAAASGILLAVLGLQAVAAFDLTAQVFGVRHRKGYYWPFLDYPMYKGAHYPGDEFPQHVVIGQFADGTEAPIGPEALGLDFWKFEKGLVRALNRGDAGAARPFAASYARRTGRRSVAFRLENHPWRLGAHGLERAPSRVLSVLPLASGDASP